MRYDGVDFYPENHHTFEIKGNGETTGEMLGKISPNVRTHEGFELRLMELGKTTMHLISQTAYHPLLLTVKVHHNQKVSYNVDIFVNVHHYKFGYQSSSDPHPARIVFHCLSVDCND